MKKICERICHFSFEPAMPYPLAVLRIGIAVVLLVQAWAVAPVFLELYGSQGIMQKGIASYLAPLLPSLLDRMTEWGVNEGTTLVFLASTYIVSLVGLLVGYRTRFMALIAWATHFIFSQGHSTSYGADAFASIFLFYMVWIPSGEAFAVDALGKKPEAKTTTRLALRLVQLHLAIAYFSTGMGKALTAQWWNGQAIWGSLMLPVYRQNFPVEWVASVPWVAMVAGWGTLLIEIGYPLLMFLSGTRRLWITLVVGLHMGIGVLLGLHVFSAIMIVLTVSLFAVPASGTLNWNRGQVFESEKARPERFIKRYTPSV